MLQSREKVPLCEFFSLDNSVTNHPLSPSTDQSNVHPPTAHRGGQPRVHNVVDLLPVRGPGHVSYLGGWGVAGGGEGWGVSIGDRGQPPTVAAGGGVAGRMARLVLNSRFKLVDYRGLFFFFRVCWHPGGFNILGFPKSLT